MIKNLALALCVIGALVLAGWSARTPPPLPASAPATVFSAGRAMVDNRVIARTPHPVGSAANGAVRDYLVQRMTALGLQPQVQRTVAFQRVPRSPEPFVLGATVENVVGVLPGRDRAAPAVALMAHYDSVPGSPGAADDAAGVAAALEVMRILKEGDPPARDVVLILTDGEEAGLLGAHGFFREHPLARHVGYVINMESRGGGGQARMFQTSSDNGEVIRLFRSAAVRPATSSLIVYLYERMPNDTDFTVSKAANVPGLNFAFIGGQFDYHSPTSTSDNLDQGSLQHLGDQVLAQTRAAANAPALPGKSPSQVYADILGTRVLAYPPVAGWAVLGGAVVLLAIGVVRARRRGAFVWSDVARGVGSALYLAVAAVALLRLARRATGAGFGFMEQRYLLAQVHVWEAALLLVALGVTLYVAATAGRGSSRFQAALLAVVAGAGSSAFGLDIPGLVIGGVGAVLALATFGRPSRLAGAWTGVAATALLVAIGLQAAAPPTAFLIAWPLTVAALMGAVSAMGSVRAGWMSLLVAVPAAVALGWVLTFADGVFLGLDMVELLALFAWLGALLLWPLIQAEPEAPDLRLAALVVILAGFAVTAAVRLIPPWSARHPQAAIVTYVQNLDTGKAQRIAPVPDLAPWTEAVLKADGGAIGKQTLPVINWRRPVWSAPAKPVPAVAPQTTFARQPDGSLLLTVVPPPGARGLALDLRSSQKLSDATLNGRPTKLFDQPGQWSRLRFEAVPQGITVGFRSVAGGALEVVYAAETEDWPAQATPLPEHDAKIMGFASSGSLVATGARRFTW